MSRLVTVINAGLGEPSTTKMLATKIRESVQTQVSSRGESVEFHEIELRTLAQDLMSTMSTSGISTPRLDEVRETLSSSDGLIAATPVFSASYSGLFKSFFDILDTDALNGMPTIIAATAGTPRHALVLDYAMRPLFVYLRAVVVPTGVFAATSDFGGDEGNALENRIRRAACELSSLVVSESGAVGGFVPNTDDDKASGSRQSGVGLKNDGRVVPFAQLIGKYT